jgi:hypothetical protein
MGSIWEAKGANSALRTLWNSRFPAERHFLHRAVPTCAQRREAAGPTWVARVTSAVMWLHGRMSDYAPAERAGVTLPRLDAQRHAH